MLHVALQICAKGRDALPLAALALTAACHPNAEDETSGNRVIAGVQRNTGRVGTRRCVHVEDRVNRTVGDRDHFSILQRKVLTPNDFDSLFTLEDRILAFQERYQEKARPFQWQFTREDLASLLAKLALQDAA
jgi:hypothetical protein